MNRNPFAADRTDNGSATNRSQLLSSVGRGKIRSKINRNPIRDDRQLIRAVATAFSIFNTKRPRPRFARL